MPHNPLINVEVVYASTKRYKIIALALPFGSTLLEAITASEILQLFPEIDLAQNQVGVFGTIKSLQDTLEAGDRVEIYRPLPQSAMSAREARLRLQKEQQKAKQQRQVTHHE